MTNDLFKLPETVSRGSENQDVGKEKHEEDDVESHLGCSRRIESSKEESKGEVEDVLDELEDSPQKASFKSLVDETPSPLEWFRIQSGLWSGRDYEVPYGQQNVNDEVKNGQEKRKPKQGVGESPSFVLEVINGEGNHLDNEEHPHRVEEPLVK